MAPGCWSFAEARRTFAEDRSEPRAPKALRQAIATIWGLFEYICVGHAGYLMVPSGGQDAQIGH